MSGFPAFNEMYKLRPATHDDYDFMYDLLVATMREYVDQTWGWEDAYQQKRFRATFRPESYRIIVVRGRDIGALSVDHREDELHLAEIQIAPDFQGQGWGTAIIQDLIVEADRRQVPVSLQVLKVNPARRLYERLGFLLSGESDSHFQMCRPQLG